MGGYRFWGGGGRGRTWRVWMRGDGRGEDIRRGRKMGGRGRRVGGRGRGDGRGANA